MEMTSECHHKSGGLATFRFHTSGRPVYPSPRCPVASISRKRRGAESHLRTQAGLSQEVYCIEKSGALWAGLAPLPAGYTPECPESHSYRLEVRDGLSRVERYRVDGWHPKAILEVVKLDFAKPLSHLSRYAECEDCP
jgi:hypothetical protein